jgi:hypothetical protein
MYYKTGMLIIQTADHCHASNVDLNIFLNQRLSAFENQRHQRSKILKLALIIKS